MITALGLTDVHHRTAVVASEAAEAARGHRSAERLIRVAMSSIETKNPDRLAAQLGDELDQLPTLAVGHLVAQLAVAAASLILDHVPEDERAGLLQTITWR